MSDGVGDADGEPVPVSQEWMMPFLTFCLYVLKLSQVGVVAGAMRWCGKKTA